MAAEMNSAPVGYLLAEHRDRPASPFFHASALLYIHHIAVLPAWQAVGIGTALISAASGLIPFSRKASS